MMVAAVVFGLRPLWQQWIFNLRAPFRFYACSTLLAPLLDNNPYSLAARRVIRCRSFPTFPKILWICTKPGITRRPILAC